MEGYNIINKAIIGGTGVYAIEELVAESRSEEITTEYGEVELEIKNIKGKDYAFLPRHGKDHSIPPHRINYRANMKALKLLGVEEIYATTAVGSCHQDYPPGSLVLIEDFIDFTRRRNYTYFDEEVRHISMAEPYCPRLNGKLVDNFSGQDFVLKEGGIYGCFAGPRFETAAEVMMAHKLGATVMGMTNVPEVVLAKELGLCYSNVSIVVNWGTGFSDEEELKQEEMRGIIEEKKEDLLLNFIEILSKSESEKRSCNCSDDFIM